MFNTLKFTRTFINRLNIRNLNGITSYRALHPSFCNINKFKETKNNNEFQNSFNFSTGSSRFQSIQGNKNQVSTKSLKFDSGTFVLKKGHMARMADSSATGKFNDTNVLVTVVNKPKTQAASFLPLTVDYMHKASASGKIPSNYSRRDIGASNYEILVSRMIDRSIRPLFTQNEYNTETQIVCNLLSFNGQDSPDIVCINTVSYALYNSNLKWNGPIGCVRVGMIDDNFVINPSKKDLEKSPLNIVLTVADNQNIVMIEAWADNIDQQTFTNALSFGAKEAYKIVDLIKKSSDIESENNIKQLNNDLTSSEISNSSKALEEINNMFLSEGYSKIYDVLTDYEHDKQSRDEAISQIRNSTINVLLKDEKNVKLYPQLFNYQNLSNQFMNFVKDIARNLILQENKRVDGRKLKELRKITCKKDLYPSLHGSSLFQRGQTQVLSTITFDSPDTMYKSEIISNMMSPSITNFDRNFMLHYEFPGYAINEISRMGGRADRREIGHGALAEKAIYSMIPEDYPFTIRAHCEVLESNGSSSMASVCATSMALLDAGVPIKHNVCGVAMGIITEMKDDKIMNYEILNDISGFEDYAGDMDFKIAGTTDGITAVQADFKITGLPMNIIKQVLERSKSSRATILGLMNKVIAKPRTDKKNNTPVIREIEIPIEQRGKLIGPGGINLRRISSDTGVTLNSKDETTFTIFAPNSKALNDAEEMINTFLTAKKEPVLEFGGVYTARIIEIRESGLMIQFYPNMKPALLPNSQIDGKKILHGGASDYKIGQEIQVKYFGRDPVDGRMRISRKAIFNSYVHPKDLYN